MLIPITLLIHSVSLILIKPFTFYSLLRCYNRPAFQGIQDLFDTLCSRVKIFEIGVVTYNFKNLKFFFNVYLFLRDRQSMSGGGVEKEWEIQNPKQVPGPELSAQSPTWGSNS